jgi:hypothetical protein
MDAMYEAAYDSTDVNYKCNKLSQIKPPWKPTYKWKQDEVSEVSYNVTDVNYSSNKLS